MTTTTLETTGAGAPRKSRLVGFRELRLLLVILVFGIGVTWYDAGFARPETVSTIMLLLASYAIMACGMTILLVSGGFDLSVASVAAISAMTAAVLMKKPEIAMPWPWAVACGLATGAAFGLFNGLVIAKLGINPFITTLGSMMLARGLTLIVSGGVSWSGFNARFTTLLGTGHIGKTIQAPIAISIVLVVIFDVFLRKSRFFRQNYYIGGNEQAAWLSGIQVNRIKIFNYGLSGTLAALAGIVSLARFDSVDPNAFEGDELKVITAVILGGASLSGGRGTVLGAFLGCVLLAMIRPAINYLPISDPSQWEKFIIGSLLILAVLMDRIGRR
jgi:ribose transport system permease protein